MSCETWTSTTGIESLKCKRGMTITYFDFENNTTQRGIIEEEEVGAFLIFTPRTNKKQWFQKKNIRIYMVHSENEVFSFHRKSFDHIQNDDIISLLNGSIRSVHLDNNNLSYFRRLFQLIKPITGIVSLFLENITEPVDTNLISFFPNVQDLQIISCSSIDWSSIKTLRLKRLLLDGIDETLNVSNILCRYINIELEVLILKNIHEKINLNYCFFDALRELVLADCSFQKIAYGEEDDFDPSYLNLSFVRFSNLPYLNFISPKLIRSCETFNLSDVPMFNQENIFQYCNSLKEIAISRTGFLKCPSFSACKQLSSFSVSFQTWKTLPAELKDCAEMNDFEITNCLELDNFPASFVEWKKLRYLKLSHCGFRSIPLDILKICKTGIILSHLNISEIGNLNGNLEGLILDSLPLQKLPDTICCLKNLKEISLFNLDLQQFPKNWTACTSLERFSIRRLLFPKLHRQPIFFNHKCKRIMIFHASCFSPVYLSSFEYQCLMLEQNKVALPEHFRCLICHGFIKCPSINSAGYTYCEICIREWLKIRMVEPHTNQTIQNSILFPNRTVERLSHDFLKKHVHLFFPNYYLSSVTESKY